MWPMRSRTQTNASCIKAVAVPLSQPWLGPDILEVIDEEHSCGAKDLVLVPIGFVSDHIEIIFDLDTQARERCRSRSHLPARPNCRDPSALCEHGFAN